MQAVMEKQEDTYIEVELASIGRRLFAKLIDNALVLIVVFLSLWIATIAGDEEGDTFLLAGACGLLALLALQAFLLTRDGQTLGKKLMQIQIVHSRTHRNGGFVPNVLVRAWANFLIGSFVPFYSLVDACFILTTEARCLHDRIASTKVVKVRRGADFYGNDIVGEAWTR